jgi:hypothetical protein
MKEDGKKSEVLRTIKHEIQASSTSRRERKRAQPIRPSTHGGVVSGLSVFSAHDDEELHPCEPSGTLQRPMSLAAMNGPRKAFATGPSIDGAASLAFLHESQGEGASAGFYAQDAIFEVDFITKYLDYVFPTLFPFYKPAIFETGRSWLLSLLNSSKIALHSTLSLTAYVFTTALTDAYGASYADCNDQLWNRLSSQAQQCFNNMQNEVCALLASDTTSTAVEKVHMMESIVQVLGFESIVGKSEGWDLHLTASTTLLEQLLQSQASSRSRMLAALLSLGPPIWYKSENDSYIWSPDQAGLRFFAALLVVADIMASTAQGREPRLAKHYPDILGDDDGAPVLGFTRIRLSSIMGCQNSIMAAIGEIASLDALRSTAIDNNDFPAEISDKAASINSRVECIRTSIASDGLDISTNNGPDLAFLSYTVRAIARSPCALTCTVWSHAAQIYLATVVADSSSSSSTIDDHVSALLRTTHRVRSEHLRTLAWTLCVAGCFASPDQRAEFRSIFAAKTALELIGSLGTSWQIMQKVWEARSNDEESFRDFASCLNIFGEPALLI